MAGEFEIKKQKLKRDAPPPEEQGGKAGGSGSRRVPDRPKARDDNLSSGSISGSPDDPSSIMDENGDDSGSVTAAKAGGKKKKIIFGMASVLLLLLGSLALLKFESIMELVSGPTQKLEPVTSITRPLPVPEYREMLNFLLLGLAEGQKTITAIRMEVEYHSPSRYQNFKEQNVLFRETVYSFLQKQNASRNTTRSWQVAIERELLDYIRITLPLSRADSLKLAQVENL